MTESDLIIRGANYWDMLESDVKQSGSLSIFKKRIKQSNSFDNPSFTNHKLYHGITSLNSI